MFVDKRDEKQRQLGGRVENPRWVDVESALRMLDGTHRTEVTLSKRGDDLFLGVYGGAEGRYYVGVWTEHEEGMAVVSDPDADGYVVMMGGGQESRYPARMIVTLDVALKAVSTYFRNAGLDFDLSWEPD